VHYTFAQKQLWNNKVGATNFGIFAVRAQATYEVSFEKIYTPVWRRVRIPPP
jgi:hypothetical protein